MSKRAAIAARGELRAGRIYAWDLAHKMNRAHASPLIVCADDSMVADGRLVIEGAVSLQQFKSMEDSLPKDREIVFYSSSPEDRTAAERVVEYQDRGYSRVSFLEGGILAWDSIVPFLPAHRFRGAGLAMNVLHSDNISQRPGSVKA